MTNAELREVRERCEAATAPPWIWPDSGLYDDCLVAPNDPIDSDDQEYHDTQGTTPPPTRIIVTDGGYYPPHNGDRDFIAHAREDIPNLLTHIDALQARLEEAEKYVALATLARCACAIKQPCMACRARAFLQPEVDDG